jgi:predicted nucleotidyltransferase
MREGLQIDAATLAAVAELCRHYHVRRLDIFGSAVRADFDPARSDVDFLVTFEPVHQPEISGYMELVERLEAAFGRSVDLVSDSAIENPYLRQAVDEERQQLYPAL